MLTKAYSLSLDACARVARVARVVERRDRSLGSQMRRAVASVSLNIAEGGGNEKGNSRLRYITAIGSARETIAALEVADAMQYVKLDEEAVDRLDQVIAILYRTTHR